VRKGQHVTARLTMAARNSVRTTLQRWNGSAWVNVKWVYLKNGTGSYTFVAATKGTVRWRFVVPASTSPEGLPVGGVTSAAFSYNAS
jgi:outer membrane protein assembly factor BamB